MSLLKPSAGEIVDRLSIIALKLESGNRATHLLLEQTALIELLREKTEVLHAAEAKPPHVVVQPLVVVQYACDSLSAVNAFIWHKEDEVRRLGRTGEWDGGAAILVAKLAIDVRALADRRHELIAEIDRLFGEPRTGKEKSWMKKEEDYHGYAPVGGELRCPHCQGLVNMP